MIPAEVIRGIASILVNEAENNNGINLFINTKQGQQLRLKIKDIFENYKEHVSGYYSESTGWNTPQFILDNIDAFSLFGLSARNKLSTISTPRDALIKDIYYSGTIYIGTAMPRDVEVPDEFKARK